jgi:hypothetical protein
MFDLPTQNDGVNLRPMVGAIIYIRVSTKEQTENLSLPTQLRVCEEYCRREGFEILERFKEEGESAKTADLRAQREVDGRRTRRLRAVRATMSVRTERGWECRKRCSADAGHSWDRLAT